MEENIYNSVEGYGKTFCHTCLSVDRTLFPLGKYSDVYYNIFSNFLTMDWPQTMVCWECRAVLKKLKLFQAKVEHSQRLLLSHLSDKRSPLPTLSSLTSTIIKPELALNVNIDEEIDNKSEIEIFTEDIINEIFNKETANNEQYNIQVKEENIDIDDFESNSNNELLDAVKSEVEDVEIDEQNARSNGKKKYYKVNKYNEYKITDKITRKDLKKMCKTKYVAFDEIRNMLEIEADSDLYRFRYKCKSCVLSWPKVEYLKQHDKKYHNACGNFLCDYCQRRFKSRKRLSVHLVRHRERFECRACGQVAAGRDRMKRHLIEVHRVSCNSCEATKKRKCSCPECGQSYASAESMRNHYNYVHMKQSKYKCLECDLQFLNRTKYVNHMQFKHEGKKKEKNKLCSICGRGFATNKILTNHIRTHTGERPFECAQCAARFTQKHAMLSHVSHVHHKLKRHAHANTIVQ